MVGQRSFACLVACFAVVVLFAQNSEAGNGIQGGHLVIDHAGFADHYFTFADISSDGDSFGCSELVDENDDDPIIESVVKLLKPFGAEGYDAEEDGYWKPNNESFIPLNISFIGSQWENASNCKVLGRTWTNNLDRLKDRDVDRFDVEAFQWPAAVLGFPSDLGAALLSKRAMLANRSYAGVWTRAETELVRSADTFQVMVRNREISAGLGYFSISITCDNLAAPLTPTQTYCVFFKKPTSVFPPIFTMVILGALIAVGFALLLGCVGGCLEMGMEKTFKKQMEGDNDLARADKDAENEHKPSKKK